MILLVEVVRQIARLDAGFQEFNITFLEFLKYIIFFSRTSGALQSRVLTGNLYLFCVILVQLNMTSLESIETLSEDSTSSSLDFVHPNIPEFMYEFRKGTPHTY